MGVKRFFGHGSKAPATSCPRDHHVRSISCSWESRQERAANPGVRKLPAETAQAPFPGTSPSKEGTPRRHWHLAKARPAQCAKRKALKLVVVGSCPTVGVFGEWGVSTSLSAHPHGTTQQTQVFAALACKHAKEVTPMVRQQRGPPKGASTHTRTGKKYPDKVL